LCTPRVLHHMKVGIAEYVTAVVFPLLMCVVLMTMARRKLYVELPCFFLYVCYYILQSVTELVLLQKTSDATYFYGYYLLQVVSFALSFGVIYEVFGSVLRPYDALRLVGGRAFLIATAVLCVVGLILFSFGPGDQNYRLVRSIDLFQRSLRFVQIGLLISLFVLSRALGLSWRANAFGIALGYGIYASAEIVIMALKVEYPIAPLRLLSLVNGLAFGVAQLIWTWYILQPEKIRNPIRVIPYNDIAKWNEKLEVLLKRKAA
jgi:hypothetical protein